MSGWLAILLAFAVGSGADVVVVRPKGWSPSLQKWKLHREEQGFRVHEVEPATTAEATRERIRNTVQPNTASIQYIILAADAPAFIHRGDEKKSSETIPTFYVDSKVTKNFGSEPTIATDFLYADLEQNGQNHAAVGRISAKTPEELQSYLTRVIAYENSASFRPWRREVDIVAGVGGFGAIADAVVEGATRQLLTDDIPQEYRMSMTYASPSSVYYPAPTCFSDAVIDRMNDGGQFWVYLGHGYVDTLDYVPFENRLMSILDRSSLHKVSISAGPPICIFLACYVGAFDARESSMAEQLLMCPDGPIAIVAGSRVTMPYAMGILGGEMLDQCFKQKVDSIGKVLLNAKLKAVQDDVPLRQPRSETATSRRELLDSMAKALSPEGHSIADERIEHNYLFNLLGDPILQISHPRTLSLETAEEISAGSDLIIRGHSAVSGKLVVELAYPRQRIPDAAKQLRMEKSNNSPDRMNAIYEAANNLTVSHIEMSVETGDFEVKLPVDSACHGSYLVLATVYGSNAWSAGSANIKVKRP